MWGPLFNLSSQTRERALNSRFPLFFRVIFLFFYFFKWWLRLEVIVVVFLPYKNFKSVFCSDLAHVWASEIWMENHNCKSRAKEFETWMLVRTLITKVVVHANRTDFERNCNTHAVKWQTMNVNQIQVRFSLSLQTITNDFLSLFFSTRTVFVWLNFICL